MKRIGIFGGSFDPVHNGHMAMASDAVRLAGLDEVVMIPARIQPFKQEQKAASGEDRFNMLALAAGCDDHITVSKYELQQEGVSYTYLTLRAMQEFYGPEARLYFITGADSFIKIDTWRNAPEILGSYSHIIGARPGYLEDELTESIERINDTYGTEIFRMNNREVDISATEIRAKIMKGESIERLVPQPVERYIQEHGLYRV